MRFIDLNGILQKARRFVSGSENLQEEEVKNPGKLAEILKSTLRRVSSLEAIVGPEPACFEVNCGTEGATINLAHNFGCPVTYSVINWAKRESYLIQTKQTKTHPSYLQYDMGVGVWTNAANDRSIGQRIRLKKAREIAGIRFAFVPNAATTYNVKCKIYNDSTGALIATTETVQCLEYGFYEALFDTPVSQDLTGVDIIICVYETSGARYWYVTDANWTAITLEFPDYTVKHHQLAGIGDVRPTAAFGFAGHAMIEPIFNNNDPGPELVRQTSDDPDNVLVLKSYVAGKAVIKVEPIPYSVG